MTASKVMFVYEAADNLVCETLSRILFFASMQLPGMELYNYPAAEGERRFELFYTPADSAGGAEAVEQYIIQCKNEYARDALIRDISDALIKAGTL